MDSSNAKMLQNCDKSVVCPVLTEETSVVSPALKSRGTRLQITWQTSTRSTTAVDKESHDLNNGSWSSSCCFFPHEVAQRFKKPKKFIN